MTKRFSINPSKSLRALLSVGVILLAAGLTDAAPIIHSVTGSAGSRLPEAASAILAATGGTHVVEFSAYTNVGTFFLEGGTADTIIFRRKDPVVQSLPLTASALITFKSFPGTVVFQGLSFRADAKTSWLLNGSETGKANGNLVFDSCQIFTNDSLTSANLITWLGAAGSKIEFRRSYLVAKYGQSSMDLLADTISLDHTVVNAAMSLTANVRKLLALTGNTIIRAQITSVGQPPGSSASVVSIHDNIFLYPVGTHTGALNLLLMGDVTVDSLKNNARDPSYSNFDQGSYNASFSSGNNNVAFSGDKKTVTELWNWDIAGETTRGAYNPAGARAIPRYNIFPGNVLFAKRLSVQDSVRLTLDSAELPRLIDANYGVGTSYSPYLDTVRSFWLKDTVLAVSGPAAIGTVELPSGTSLGTPILFSNIATTYTAGASGAEGSLVFTNGTATSKSFIPGFGAQNTLKGSGVGIKGLSADTSVIFSSVTRTGRTRFLANPLASSSKRWRVIQRGGKPLGFHDTTNAEGSGTILFGLSKTGADTPFSNDSLQFWLGGPSSSSSTDSAGKYWGRTNFTFDLKALLIERLAVGQGRDTVTLAQARVITSSVVGHQLSVDSSFMPTQVQFPDMGNFSKGISFGWLGRAAGDTFYLELKKSAAKQKAYLFSGGKAVDLTPVKEDSTTITVSFGIGDSGKSVFLARRFTIPAGTKTSLALGKDSVADLLSSLPGEYRLDTSVSTSGLMLDTFRVWTKRRVVMENLSLQSVYTLWVDAPAPIKPEKVSAFIFNGAKWDSTSFTREGSRYRINVPANLSSVVIAEKLEPADTLPIYPQSKPSVSIQGGNLLLKPTLTPGEKARLQAFHVDVTILDATGTLTKKSFQTLSSDSTLSVSLPAGSMVIYRTGYEARSGKITWDSTFTRAGTDSRAFLDAVNASAPSIQPLVWDLVGFSQNVSLTTLLSPIGAEASKSVAQSWNGKWVNLNSSATLAKGKGYLLGVTQTLRASLDDSQPYQLKADTVALDTGWQLISSPVPFPTSDAAVGLDSTSVSYFYSVEWQGTGKDAKYNWVLADTLKPFKGYAVHSAKPGKLIFNPLKDIGPLAKQGATDKVTLTLDQFSTGARAMLYFRPGALSRSSQGVGFLKPEFQAAWKQPDGSMIQVDSLQTDLLIKSPLSGMVGIKANRQAAPGKVFALWNPSSAKLAVFQDSVAVQAEPGWNGFKLFEVKAENISSLEKRLQSTASERFEILSIAHTAYGHGVSLSIRVPARYSFAPTLRIQVLDVLGRQVGASSLASLMPGVHSVDVSDSRWKQGILFLRLTLIGGGTEEAISTRFLNAGGGL